MEIEHIQMRGEGMRKELLEKILQMTKRQEQSLDILEIDEFINLLEEKQKVMNEIDEINEYEPQELTSEERNILMSIKELDEKNKKCFNLELENTKEELRKMRQFKQRDDYYTNPYSQTQEEGLFIDKK